jgi:hypothetical protein
MILQYQCSRLGNEILSDRDVLARFLAVAGLFDAAEGRLGEG